MGVHGPVLERAENASLDLRGVIREYVDAVIDDWVIPLPDTNPATAEMFEIRDTQPYRSYLQWSGEFAGKYLTGAVQLLRLTGSKPLRERIAAFVDRLVALQDPADGYLGPYPKAERLALWDSTTGEWTWDLWNHYHLMLGLVLWFEDSGDRRAFACARAIADLVCARFLDTGTAIVDVSYKYSTEMNHAVLHGLAVLYRMTGTEVYLRMAEEIVHELRLRDRDGEPAGDYVRQALAGTEFHRTPRPRWESLHALMGLAELSSITGNPDYRTTVERFWWSIVEHDRHNNGGFSSGEGAVGNPYHRGSIETCCTVAWIAYGVEMLRLTGNSIVADEIELSTLNQVVGYHFRDGGPCTYDTPMDGARISAVEQVQWQRRPGSEQMICCTANGPRGFGMISDWALMRDGDGLVLNWYGPSTMAARVRETSLTLTQVTDYPRDGRVTLAVVPEAPLACALKLRVPYWSAATAVSVNGRRVSAVTPGRYLSLNRMWRPGDVVELDLDLSLRYWTGERECAGTVSMYAGPLLMAVRDAADAPDLDPIDPADLSRRVSAPVPRSSPVAFQPPSRWSAGRAGLDSAAAAATWSNTPGARACYEFDGIGVRWRFLACDHGGVARVSIDGREVAEVDLYGATAKPDSWTCAELSYGPHTLEIVVAEHANPRSGDRSVNVVDLTPLQPQAVLQAEHAGHTITLEDFGTVGTAGDAYRSWLPLRTGSSAPFSTSNPGRTWRP